jgi:hypothetical protein
VAIDDEIPAVPSDAPLSKNATDPLGEKLEFSLAEMLVGVWRTGVDGVVASAIEGESLMTVNYTLLGMVRPWTIAE